MAIQWRLVFPGLVTLSSALFLAGAQNLARAEGWRLSLQEPLAATVETPVAVEISSSIPAGVYDATGGGNARPITVQVFDELGKRWLGMVLPADAKVASYDLHARPVTADTASVGFSLASQASRVSIFLDQSLMTECRTDAGAKPFLFPLIGPTGAAYTRAYPMANVSGEDRDHPHQRSLWFTHGKVNGIDFWSEETGHGSIKETSRETLLAGPVLARLRTANLWLSPKGSKVCEDHRVITLMRTESARIVDFEITLTASNGPVVFGDTKEGMFGLRVASSMDVNKKQGGRIINAAGQLDDQAWGKASPWVDYTGPVQGKTVGIAILNHPRSSRYPTTWHVRTYGLFAANPFGWHDFGLGKSGQLTLGAGESLWFGYRVILHSGETAAAHIKEAFANYGHIPRMVITTN